MTLIEPDGETFFARGSRLSLVAISIFEKMAGVELRSRSGIRSDFRNRLQVHRSSSRTRLDLYSIAVGRTMYGRQLTFGRGAGFFVRSDSFI